LLETPSYGEKIWVLQHMGLCSYTNTHYSNESNQFRIIHLDGVADLPLMYGPSKWDATLRIDDTERTILKEFSRYIHSEKSSRLYRDLGPAKEFWSDVAIFSVHGRDVLDHQANAKHWDLRLISAQLKTMSVAIEGALLSCS
jgi:hypothetical protein